MPFTYSIQRILEIVGDDAQCFGEYQGSITGIGSLSEAVAGDLSFLGNPKYRELVADSAASVVLLPLDYTEAPKAKQLYIKVENPSYALALLCFFSGNDWSRC